MAMPQLFVVQVEEEPPVRKPRLSVPVYFLSTTKDEWKEVPLEDSLNMLELFRKVHGRDALFSDYRITLNGRGAPSGAAIIERDYRVEMYRV